MGGGFHYVINAGPSFAESVNIVFPGLDDKAIETASREECDCESRCSSKAFKAKMQAERKKYNNPAHRA